MITALFLSSLILFANEVVWPSWMTDTSIPRRMRSSLLALLAKNSSMRVPSCSVLAEVEARPQWRRGEKEWTSSYSHNDGFLSWDNNTSASPMLFSVFRRKYNYFRLRNDEHGCKSYLSFPQFRSIIPREVLLYIEVTFLGFIHWYGDYLGFLVLF